MIAAPGEEHAAHILAEKPEARTVADASMVSYPQGTPVPKRWLKRNEDGNLEDRDLMERDKHRDTNEGDH